eukprot:Selendium_serpulae@DN6408_c1_g1_i3.p1
MTTPVGTNESRPDSSKGEIAKCSSPPTARTATPNTAPASSTSTPTSDRGTPMPGKSSLSSKRGSRVMMRAIEGNRAVGFGPPMLGDPLAPTLGSLQKTPRSSRSSLSIDTPRFMRNNLDETHLLEVTKFTKLLQKGLAMVCKSMILKKNDLQNDALYTGELGIALAALRTSRIPEFGARLSEAYTIVQEVQARLSAGSRRKIRGPSMLTGEPGFLALKAVVMQQMRSTPEELENALRQLLRFCGRIKDEDPDIIMNGRAGYLQSILFVRQYLSRPTFGSAEVMATIDEILSHGMRDAPTQSGTLFPLCWPWEDTVYLGAAYGAAGIIFTLLLFEKELLDCSHCAHDGGKRVLRMLGECIDIILDEYRTESGNILQKAQACSDNHVQWCHGAPGFVPLLLRASTMIPGKAEEYKKVALDLGHVIWERGLIYKGLGLCHGIAGNGMALLSLWRFTRDDIWLTRAHQFGFACVSNYSSLFYESESPTSLFEGIAGAACYFSGVSVGISQP